MFVSVTRAFLPLEDPVINLPSQFGDVEALLGRMPVVLPDGSSGLLGEGKLRDAVHAELSDHTADVTAVTDERVLRALHRDYCFLASGYVLQPVDLTYRKTGKYGNTDDEAVLPVCIASPLCVVSDKLGCMPWLDYVDYALCNFKRKDASKPLSVENLDLIRLAHGGQDEVGFTAVHIAMEAQAGGIVSGAEAALAACERGDHSGCAAALQEMERSITAVNEVRSTMWVHSRPKNYLDLRTWIMGAKGNPDIIPGEVIYYSLLDGKVREESPRGETGAQSSMIPLLDVVLGIDEFYPDNELTRYLYDLRPYRPEAHRNHVDRMGEKSRRIHFKEFVASDAACCSAAIGCIKQVMEFRKGHWNFAKSYISENTSYPTATGGTPMASWLPNMITASEACLQFFESSD